MLETGHQGEKQQLLIHATLRHTNSHLITSTRTNAPVRPCPRVLPLPDGWMVQGLTCGGVLACCGVTVCAIYACCRNKARRKITQSLEKARAKLR